MYVSNYASRSDIHLNSCLRAEIPGTSLPDSKRGSSDFRLPSPQKKNIGLQAKTRITMILNSQLISPFTPISNQ
jgi:hypothetical protein